MQMISKLSPFVPSSSSGRTLSCVEGLRGVFQQLLVIVCQSPSFVPTPSTPRFFSTLAIGGTARRNREGHQGAADQVDFIRANKGEILGFLDKTWGIKNPVVREGFYADMLGLYSRTGIVSDDTIANVVRFTQATRKTQEDISVSDITDGR